MEFNIDFGNVAQAPAPRIDDRNAPLFAAAPGVLLPLGGDEVVYRLRTDGSHHVMTRQVFEAFARCAAFRGLDRHAVDIARALPGLAGREAAVRGVLDNLVARGLLLSADDWLGALRAAPVPAVASRVDALRLDSDAAAAAGLLDGLANAGDPASRVLVFDDGGVAASTVVADALARLRARRGSVQVVDAARRRALGDALVRAVPAAAGAIAPLFGADAAGARNLAMLLAAGARLVWLDGRAALPLHRAADASPGLDLAGGHAVPIHFHARAEEALARGVALEEEPIAALASGCGATLGALIRDGGAWPVDRSALHGLEPAALTQLVPSSRVAAVVVGQRGAARERGREWLFLLDAQSRERFWSERDTYLRTLDQPLVWHGPSRARLLARTLEAPVAFDGTDLLPPLPGAAPADDALWGLLLSTLRPRDAVLYAPWTLAVAPAPAARPLAGWSPETPATGALLTDLLAPRTAELRAAGAAQRLLGVAAALDDLAAAPHAVLADLLAEYVAFCRADAINRLQEAFAGAGTTAPLHWQADVRALIEANGRALDADQPARLAGWPDTLDAAGCTRRFAADVAGVAAALRAWPALWAHALERGAALADG